MLVGRGIHWAQERVQAFLARSKFLSRLHCRACKLCTAPGHVGRPSPRPSFSAQWGPKLPQNKPAGRPAEAERQQCACAPALRLPSSNPEWRPGALGER